MHRRESEFHVFIRIILATVVLIQYLAMPFAPHVALGTSPSTQQ